MWSWRFHSLGPRTVLGRCRTAPNPKSISIGHNTTLSHDWCLSDLSAGEGGKQPKIRIGSHCTILHEFQFNASESVEIRDYVLIAPRVFVTDSDHIVAERGARTTSCERLNGALVVTERNCWLGVNAVVLKGVRIGHHSLIGANAGVTRDVPPRSTVVGVPGRVISLKESVPPTTGCVGQL